MKKLFSEIYSYNSYLIKKMDHHKSLYKCQRTLTPRQYNNINRKLQEDKRGKHRRDIHLISRNLSMSPEHQWKEAAITSSQGNKKDVNDQSVQQCQDLTQSVVKASNTKSQKKIAEEESFIKRFRAFKEAKKNAKKVEKKKPFLTCVRNECRGTTSSSLVPRDHHKEFRPPVGLNHAEEIKKVKENQNPVVKFRRSVYTIVPTPPKKKVPENPVKNVSTAKKALQTYQHKKVLGVNKAQIGFEALAKSAINPSVSENPIKNVSAVKKALEANQHKNVLGVNKAQSGSASLVKNATKTTVSENPIKNVSAAKKAMEANQHKIVLGVNKAQSGSASVVKNATKPTVSNNINRKIADFKKEIPVQMPANKKDIEGRCFKMPPPLIKNISPAKKKPLKSIAKIKKSPLKCANLAQNFKAKNSLNRKKANLSILKLNRNKIISIVNSSESIQTPKEFTNLNNNFSKFVTSTKLKQSSENIQIDGISPIKHSPKNLRNNTSAKRAILTNDYNIKPENPIEKCSSQNVKRFNFLRYSDADIVTESAMKNREGKISVFSNKENDVPDKVETTPIKSGPEERPPNYLSPFVSVTRGKVSLKKEKEKRNSLYLQDAIDSYNLSTQDHQNTPKYSVEVRRTIEAVRYFRKQLQDEIDRLHQLCDIWEKYKTENLEMLQNANGEDMINVTIGQTRLLTSKKFIQFKGLIDRCEARSTGIGDVEYDGSEDTKPITTVDLEGFWSMLGLQVDNLDKRFENLNRWKANDWIDPDEVKPKNKTKLTKVKKPKPAPAAKSKPNSALQQMLRKMQAEMKKANGMNEIVVFTSSRQKLSTNSNNNSPVPRKSLDTRISVVVKDRKFFSTAPTVLTFSSPNRRVSLRNKSSQQSLKSNEDLDNLQMPHSLRKSVLLNEKSTRVSINPKSPLNIYNSKNSQDLCDVNNKTTDRQTLIGKCLSPRSPISTSDLTGRKSILKTPGTGKTIHRNVIFNEKLRVKKFNFLITENDEDANNTHEEDLAKSCEDNSPQRTLTLRNRKIRLRPSCEIVIPKN